MTEKQLAQAREKEEKRQRRLEAEIARMKKMMEYEERFADRGLIAGIDEVGRGPLAGPVVTCAVILPSDHMILYLNDSKKLSEKKREELDRVIRSEAIAYSLGGESPQMIDDVNILQATYSAMRKSVAGLRPQPDFLLNDAVTIPDVSIPQCPIIHGDALSASIAAASIVAKVARDRMMVEYDRLYPEYGFARHKGYGTREHIEALRKYGPCPIHRRTFISKLLSS